MDIKWNIDFLEEVSSTNDIVYKSLVADPTLQEGYGVVTRYQNNGRGQRGNAWESQNGRNLLLSFVLKPGLPASRQFLLSQIISLAIAEYLIDHDIDKVKIKWPNDIYVGNRKIAGILIQNILQGRSIKNSIIGIGLNLNQLDFQSDAPNPISLKAITNKEYSINTECLQLLDAITKNYAELFKVRKAKPQNMYRFLLYRLNEKATFLDREDVAFEGIIRGVDDHGNLEVERKHGIEHFGFKEIKYVI